MKRCPECRRDYVDDSLSFCLEDGSVLDEVQDDSEHATAILPGVVSSETKTKHFEPATPTTSFVSRHYLIAIVAVVAIIAAGFAIYRYWPTQKQIGSIAVMPFANQSGNTDLEYLADGMTESLISNLSQIPSLNVKARSSVFRYKGKDIDPAATGRELSVEAILNGRLVQQSNTVVLYTELVDTKTENVIWTGEYSRPMTNVVLLQGELTRDVASKLQAKLSGEDKQRFERPQTTNDEAYRLYLMGRSQINRLTDDGFKKAAELFEQAIAKDPKYAMAYAGLADAYNRLGGFNAAPPKESFPKARDAALKAIELDATLAEAHTVLATGKLFYDWDWANAEKEYRRAIELNPGYADAHMMYALYLSVMQRFDEARSEAQLAQQLDPLSIEKQTSIGDVLLNERRYDDALVEYQKALEMDTNSGLVHWCLGRTFLEKGRFEESIASFKRSIPLSGESPDETVDLARAYARSGNKTEANKILSSLLLTSKERYISPTTIGSIYAALGENDKAFDAFEKALHDRDYLLVLVKIDPMFDPVRLDPRFSDLVRRVGFQP